jgi:hypothetical protein
VCQNLGYLGMKRGAHIKYLLRRTMIDGGEQPLLRIRESAKPHRKMKQLSNSRRGEGKDRHRKSSAANAR